MAKWGEGDPRWIVEERPDATNVNNWHWTEKNADHWSKEKLRTLLVGLKMDDTVELTEMEKCEGEARANNRKAKLIFFYEWELELKWKSMSTAEEAVDGKVKVLNLSEEHEDIEDVDLEVSLSSGCKGKHAERCKEFMRVGPGAKALRKQLQVSRFVKIFFRWLASFKLCQPFYRPFFIPLAGLRRCLEIRVRQGALIAAQGGR